jgi:hypothetical protein
VIVTSLAPSTWMCVSLRPKTEADPSLTTPKLKKALGAPFAQDDGRAGLREGMRSCGAMQGLRFSPASA